MARPPFLSPAVCVAMGVFGLATALGPRDLGLVGEVAAAWSGQPPAVYVSLQPPTFADPTREPTAGSRLGVPALALDASATRPMESASLAGLRLPLQVNAYTGGLPDWPTRLFVAVTGHAEWARWLHAALGLLLVWATWRLLRVHGATVAAGAAALWLAGDFTFGLYRAWLGGTEIALLAATLLVLRGLWDRRWGGGAVSPYWLALGVGLGLHAKITFLPVLLGMAAATLLTRWDRGALGAPALPPPRTLWICAAITVALLLPGAWSLAHHLALDEAVRSHDQVGLQVGRWFSNWGGAPARESWWNGPTFVAEPLAFFARSCGAEGTGTFAAGRLFGWGVALVGTVLAWRDHADRTAPAALLRWCSLAVPLSALALQLANRDLHHLAQLDALIAVWAGLSVDRLAAAFTPPKSTLRGLTALALVAPWVASGLWAGLRTDAVIATCDSPLARASGQRAVVDLLREHQVKRVSLASYDLYGVLDLLAPEIQVDNAWGAMSHGAHDVVGRDLLGVAKGGHYLVVRPEASTIYDWSPTETVVLRYAKKAGVEAVPVATLDDARGPWAQLYEIR